MADVMTMPAEKVALIEFSRGHAECLYAQVRMLAASGVEVHLICDRRHAPRVGQWPEVTEYLYLREDSGPIARLVNLARIYRHLRRHAVRKVVINTFAGSRVKLFMLFAARLQVFGIVHDAEKLSTSRWMRWARKRVAGFFVLNDYLLDRHRVQGVSLDSVYPIFFPEYPPGGASKAEGEIRVCIPGNVEYKRRNYPGLLDALNEGVDPRIRFVILGNANAADGPDFVERLGPHRDRFVLFDGFVDDAVFHGYLAGSDLVLPLLGANGRYRTRAVSGAFNLAFGHRKPMLIEAEYMQYEDFKVCAMGFGAGELATALNRIADRPEALDAVAARMARYRKLSFEYQRAKYLRRLGVPPERKSVGAAPGLNAPSV